MQVGTRVPPDYTDSFNRANLTFKHQRVFCPERECLVMWNEPEESLSEDMLVYIGAYDLSDDLSNLVISISKSHGELPTANYIP